jgi:hypothetical protein
MIPVITETRRREQDSFFTEDTGMTARRICVHSGFKRFTAGVFAALEACFRC